MFTNNKMKMPKLYYISQGETKEEHLKYIKKMVLAGVDWVQLRLKNYSEAEVVQIALQAQEFCTKHHTKFIINDYLEVAKKINADGVHLGKEDISPKKARTILGENKIIGGTANTLEDCKNLIDSGVNYIGLGPFKFTKTKKKLSPVLEVEGYQSIIESLKKENIDTPIIAIGGITLEDLPNLKNAGVSGVAISGFLHRQENLAQCIITLKEHF